MATQFAFGKIVTDGLVLALDAADRNSYLGSGTTWNDVSGNGNNATLTNGPTFSNNNGGCIAFDATDDFATITSNVVFNFGTGDFTLETWIYPESFSTYLHMIQMPDQGTFALKANITDGAIYFYNPSFTTYGSTPNWTLVLNKWNYVAMTRVSSVAYVYLNGESKGSKTSFTTNFSNNTIKIHGGHFGGEFAQCKIATTKIYNKGLAASEILQNYNAQKSRFNL
jgi:hypothetical protein